MTRTAALEAALACVDPDEVVELALALGNIDSPSGGEHEISDYLHEWCLARDLRVRRLRVHEDAAANVLAILPGGGGGRSLLFNSHMDTVVARGDTAYFRDPDRAELHTARREGDELVGVGILNDKGPMAAWLGAAAALLRSGVRLSGDLVLTMVTGEIGHEPVDELQGLAYHGKDFGSRYVATHGGVADYALVAETTHFRPVWVEAGKAFFKIVVHGRESGVYTPYLRRPYEAAEHPSAVVRAARVVEAIEEWALRYERANTVHRAGGTVVPRVNVGAVRAGRPTQPIMTPASCTLYLDVRLPPDSTPPPVQEELRRLLAEVGVEGEVENYLFRRGYEASGAEPLVAALRAATEAEVDPLPPEPEEPTASSMWRDINVFNEIGIPAVTYGPGGGTGSGNRALPVPQLVQAARVYLRTALAICGG